MPLDAYPDAVSTTRSVVGDLKAAATAAQGFVAAATSSVKARVSRDGKIDRALFDTEQHVVHGLAWFATYAEMFNQLAGWAERLTAEGTFGEVEALLCEVVGAEYAAQLMGGISMNQGEVIRPSDFGLPGDVLGRFYAGDWAEALKTTQASKTRLAQLVAAADGRATVETTGLDETFEMIRDQFRGFADEKVAPFAHEWHLKDELIPLPLVEELGALGVFGLTIPEEFGGSGMGKTAMCVVSEELSRGYIGVGSLGTRSEIAAELILCGRHGLNRRRNWLPKLASGEVLPTAVFTEPNTGSDLRIACAHARSSTARATRTVLEGLRQRRPGSPIGCPRRHHDAAGSHRSRTRQGLSRPLHADRGKTARQRTRIRSRSQASPAARSRFFGYRGMKEYELAFDGFDREGREPARRRRGPGLQAADGRPSRAARIQTAARAVGVAQSAFEARPRNMPCDRIQFGKPS